MSALEIEREMLSHPGVLEVAVIGVKDDVVGEKVVAIVVIRPEEKSKTESDIIDSLKTHLKDKLAVYKHPKDYKFVNELPRNHLGKVCI